ncbi:MAG: thiamine-phosphate kinase [Bacteroidales bacterium]|nr:thiamine-phosphate kinase [Bacteroidales bacterium]
MAEKKKNNEISQMGEFGLIRLLTEKIKIKNRSTLCGVGDDAAIMDTGKNRTVVTTDLLTEGIHFDLIYTPLKHLGYKAVIVNLSDIYAMNAIPSQILVSIAISSKLTTEMVEELYEGIHLACELYKVDMVGGDISSSLTGLTISVTAIGEAPDNMIVYRKGAKVNDLICVSGDLGGSYMGLQLLEREKQIFGKGGSQPDLAGYDYILERQLKPEARRDIINLLAERQIKPTSMIDISDGLSSEILHLCDASETGCNIFADKIPVAHETRKAAEEMGMEPVTIALNGGEDYELLFTVSLDHFDLISAMPGISIIGHMASADSGINLIMPDGSSAEIMSMGWNSLRGRK